MLKNRIKKLELLAAGSSAEPRPRPVEIVIGTKADLQRFKDAEQAYQAGQIGDDDRQALWTKIDPDWGNHE